MNKLIQLKRINNEDYIWFIYIIISIGALISNKEERNYIINNNLNSFYKEKTINIIIFIVGIIIYLYFLYLNTTDLINTKNYNNNQITREFAALLFLIGGIIYLILEIKSINEDEIAII